MYHHIIKQKSSGENVVDFNAAVTDKLHAVIRKGKEKHAVIVKGINKFQKKMLAKFEQLRNLKSLF